MAARNWLARAFTLIELLVVIGIIAVLIAILLPTISQVRKNAEFITCRSNLNQIRNAVAMYANDYRDHYPDPRVVGDGAQSAAAFYRRGVEQPDEANPLVKETLGLPNMLAQRGYLKGREVWICPGAPERFKAYGNTYTWNVSRTNSGYTSKQRAKEREAFYVYDNYFKLPYTTNVPRGAPGGSDGTLPTTQWVFPHRYGGKTKSGAKRQGAANCMFVDGYVGILAYVERYTSTAPKLEVIRGE